MYQNYTIAFALGGLAGNNAFGAGFLQAALDCQIQPDLISCSSGQIFWSWKYLKALQTGESLEKEFSEEIQRAYPYASKDLNWLNLLSFGINNVLRPVSPLTYLTDTYKNILDSFFDIQKDWKQQRFKEIFWFKEFSSWLPSRTLEPTRPEAMFQDISDTFNDSDIAIAFNSYDPSKGEEYVHLNPAARNLLEVGDNDEKSYRKGTFYRRITSQEVEDALWLYQYGFPQGRTKLDGAYYRQILLSELVKADKIFVVRPIDNQWIGELPNNFIGLRDIETEVSFNGTYIGEKDKIELINNFLKKGKISANEYHHIEIYEIELSEQREFFDYVFESPAVFTEARNQGSSLLKDRQIWQQSSQGM
jgi:hypothetical protein